jgi:hypothetical protein
MSRIQLTVPALDPVANPETITKPNALRDWADHLPYAYPLGVAQSLYKALYQLNRHPAPVPQRQELMEIFLEPYLNIIPLIQGDSKQSDRSTGSHRDRAMLFQLIEKITTEIAYGFKKVIRDEEFNKKLKLPDALSTSIYWTIYCCVLTILFDLSAYRPESRSVWREILQLYLIAHQNGVATAKFSEPHTEANCLPNIDSEFIRILLTLSLDPLHLTRKEIWSVYRYLTSGAELARLGGFVMLEDTSGLLLVDLLGVERTRPLQPDTEPDDPDRFLILDASHLISVVEEQLATLEPGSSNKAVPIEGLTRQQSIQLLQRMSKLWQSRPSRQHPRKEQYDRLLAAGGVDAVCHFLKQGSLTPQRENASRDDHEEIHAFDVHSYLSSTATEKSHATYSCRQTNISEGGMAIVTNQSQVSDLPIGQVVLAESEQAQGEARWQTGVVRRLIQRGQSTVEIGIQFLPGKVTAVSLRPEGSTASSSANSGQPALLITDGNGVTNMLVTPPMMYELGRKYQMEITDGSVIRVFAGRMLESSGCFDRFEFDQEDTYDEGVI